MRESILRKGKALTCPVWSGGVGVDGEALLASGEGDISNGRGTRGQEQAVEDKDKGCGVITQKGCRLAGLFRYDKDSLHVESYGTWMIRFHL